MTFDKNPMNDDLHINDQIHGYVIENITPLVQIDAMAYRLTHQATGAQHLHISSQDKENTFGVVFKTIPADSTGVAHILEHTVLCGSQKYPVRDPFFSMLKRSLSTFMNAFTASDWTMYPFSTQNPNDFYNLMDVYLDAAFFPQLKELSFKQEGHRLEIETADDERLTYKGVVYNEMKGAMSSADQVMARSLLNALYPDTGYRYNSGGDPAIIPDLTYVQLKAFHQRHYHPSNACFYTYGNLPIQKHLTFIDNKIMRRFQRIDPQTDVSAQPRWSASKTARYTYAATPEEDIAHKYQVCIAWLMCDVRDTFEVLVLFVLEQILLGNAASPLRKALIDSGLGSALCDDAGFDPNNKDTLFACGLKDTREDAAEEIEQIILNVLHELVRKGIEKELVDSAIHQIEFHRKEITNTPYPYGIKLLLTITSNWLHGGQPERILRLDTDLDRLRRSVEQQDFLLNRIKTYFINNLHRVRLVLAPDPQKSQQEQERIDQHLQALRTQLTAAERAQIKQDTEDLNRLQENQEDLSCLPTLALTDIASEVQTVSPSRTLSNTPAWCYCQPTSDIFYFNAVAALAKVPQPLLPLVPFFCYAFTRLGTQKYDYTQIARRIDAATGGFSLTAHARVRYDTPGICLPILTLHGKCLNRNQDRMFDLIEDLAADVVFKNPARLKQLIAEYRAGLEAVIVQNGHRLAISLSARAFSTASTLNEIWSGVHHIQSIKTLGADLNDDKLEQLTLDLDTIAKTIVTANNIIPVFIGEQKPLDAAVQRFEAGNVLSDPNARPHDLQALNLNTNNHLPREGWTISSTVAFVAQTIATVPMGHKDAPALMVLGKLLRSLYLHREIREKGGAYGGFALYSPESGLFSLASYRDPHIVQTLRVFDEVSGFLRNSQMDKENIKEAILQVCSEIDKPDPPGLAARKAFYRQLLGLSDQARLEFKQRLLKLTKNRVLDTAQHYFNKTDHTETGIAVLAGADHLQKANMQLNTAPLTINAV